MDQNFWSHIQFKVQTNREKNSSMDRVFEQTDREKNTTLRAEANLNKISNNIKQNTHWVNQCALRIPKMYYMKS